MNSTISKTEKPYYIDSELLKEYLEEEDKEIFNYEDFHYAMHRAARRVVNETIDSLVERGMWSIRQQGFDYFANADLPDVMESAMFVDYCQAQFEAAMRNALL